MTHPTPTAVQELADALAALQHITTTDAPGTVTPPEARALLDHIHGLQLLRRGFADSLSIILREAAKNHPTSDKDTP